MTVLEHSLSLEAPRAMDARRPILAFVLDQESEGVARAALADLLTAPSDIQRGSVEDAIARLARERSPHVLLVDLGDRELPISDIARLAEVCEPGVDVIAVGVRNEVGFYRDLLQAGVSDYLVRPLTAELMRRAVLGVIDGAPSRAEPKLGKVIALIGSRRGVGTTTISANLAWHLAEKRSRRVALVDLDLSAGDCALLLNVKPSSGLRQALEAPERIDMVFIERAMTRLGDKLFVMSAEEPFADDIMIEWPALDVLLRALQREFHYIVIDVPRSARRLWPMLSEGGAMRIIVADRVLSSLRDVRRFRKEGGRPAAGQTLLLINRAGELGRAGMAAQEFAAAAELAPVATVPFDPAVAFAADCGIPAAAGQKRLGTAIAALAGEISGQRPGRQQWWRFFR
jgi:pilus assembly protein CpaE